MYDRLHATGNSVAVLVACVFKPDGFVRFVFAEHFRLAVLVTGRDEFLQFKLLEVMREIFEKVAYPRIVAVAQNNLAFKMVFVVFEFFFNVRKLSIKLILLRVLRGV